MKNVIKLLFVVAVFFATASCEDYLNEPKPTDQLTSASVYSSRAGVDAYFSGIFRLFRGQFEYNTDQATTDVGGIYSMYFARTIKGNDLIQGPSWYLFDYANDNREPTYRRPSVTWQFLYKLVKHANTIIKEVAASELSDIDKTELTAQARALRAFVYFQLGMEFQVYYNPTADAPPIYDENDFEEQIFAEFGQTMAVEEGVLVFKFHLD